MGLSVQPIQRNDPAVDFGAIATRKLGFEDRLGLGKFSLKLGAFKPCDGTNILSSEVSVVIPDRKPIPVDWRGPESDQLRSQEFAPGNVHVAGGRFGLWFRSRAAPSFFAFSMDRQFVGQIWREAFNGAGDFDIRNAIDLADPVIDGLGRFGLTELENGGPGGRMYSEGLATALAVHLLREYGDGNRPPEPHKGGLPSHRLRRVLDYIDAHLQEELSLAELAGVTNLSRHHFATAFKATTGSTPHRYVIERRVDRARALLRDPNLLVSEIAFTVGFSSQSHLTTNFRRLIGMTPSKFREALD